MLWTKNLENSKLVHEKLVRYFASYSCVRYIARILHVNVYGCSQKFVRYIEM
jgi:hypothetical protein